jgi:hypothetical protein
VSVAAVMMVRDEEDILPHVLAHLALQVDRVYALDNRSVDGTRGVLRHWEQAGLVVLLDDSEVGYWQSRKTTRLAERALADGHTWVVPVDADELWRAPDGRTLTDWLHGVPPDVQIVQAALFNHVPTGVDDTQDSNPLSRIGWRLAQPGALPKVAARLREGLTIHAGNHGADYGPRVKALTAPGLQVRHFSWRDPEQYLRKIRNGVEAYRATDLPDQIGAHWRMWDGQDDDAIRDYFWTWFFVMNPHDRDDLVYDPAL